MDRRRAFVPVIENLSGGAAPVTSFDFDFSVLPDGALPSPLEGDTWSVVGGKAINTPLLGDELVTNGNMESGDPTSNWTALSGATLDGVADERTGGAGAQSIDVILGTNNACGVSAAVANVVGKFYVLHGWVKNTDASGGIRVANGALSLPYKSSTSWTHGAGAYKATSTNGVIYLGISGSAGQRGRIDDVSNKQIVNTPELFASFTPGFTDVVMSMDITSLGAMCGFFLSLDSITNPLNWVFCYLNVDRISLIKCLNGTLSTVIAATLVTPAAGKYLMVIKNGTTYSVYYDVAQIGTDQTIDDVGVVNGEIFGLFSADPTSQIPRFIVNKITDPDVNISFFGDSITFGDTTYALRSLRLYERDGKVCTYANHAVGGGRVVGSGPEDLSSQVTAAASDNANIATFLLGTNDTDTTDNFRSSYETHINTFKATNPNAEIYLFGILERFDGVTRRDTQNPMIATVAANTGATYINTDGWVNDGDLADHLHPTAAGYIKLSGLVKAAAFS